MVRREAATFWTAWFVRWLVLRWFGLKRLGFQAVWVWLGRPKIRNIIPDHALLSTGAAGVAGTYRMRSYGNQRTRSDHRNPDRSTPGRAWSVGACLAYSLYRPCGADPGHHLVCVLSDLSIGHSRPRPAMVMAASASRQGRNCLVRGAAKSKSRLPCRTGATIRSPLQVLEVFAGQRVTLRGAIYWGFRSAVLGVLGQASEPPGVPCHGRPNAFGVAGNRF